MARPGKGRRRAWRFKLNDTATLEVSAPRGATEKQVRRRGRLSLIVGTVVAAATLSAAAYGDDVSNNLDGSVDATLESMALNVGGPDGSVRFHLAPTNTDGKSGCNLTGGGSQLVVGVASSNTSVATLSASSVTITGCDPTLSSAIAVHPVAAGTATVTLSFVSVTTTSPATNASDYNLVPGSFTVNVTASNSPPTADAGGPYSVDEGGSVGLTGTGSDPDSDPLTYAWDLDDNGSFETPGQSVTFSAAGLDGPGTQTVNLRVCDNSDACAESSATVNIVNVQPTIAISGASNVDEGSSYDLNLGAVTDPGDDTVSSYVVNWGDGSSDTYASGGVKGHTYADGPNGYAITVDLTDEDGTFLDQANALTVTVDNVKPTPTIDSLTGTGGTACIAGNQVTLGFSWTDPAGSNDTYSYDVNWGDGSTHATAASGTSPVSGLTHTYAAGGPYTIVVSVNDEDAGPGGTASSAAFSFLYNASGVLQPVNDTQAHNDPSVFKYGSTIPVKIRVTDCDNVVVSGLTPQIAVKKITGSTPPSGVDENIASTSGADTGTTMRYSDGIYMYNLATKSLADSSATYEIRITGPFNTVTANFGTRPK
jgi:hypothetical protein